MATIPTIPTWTALEFPTTAKMSQLSTAFNFLLAPPACSVFRASFAVVTATLTAVSFDTEHFDTDNMHDNTNQNRITIRTAGKYLFNASATWQANGTGYRRINFKINGASYTDTVTTTLATGGGDLAGGSAYFFEALAVNDIVEVELYQTSGGNLNANVQAAARWMGT